MKKILYIHQYFKTPFEGGAIRSYHITKGMVARGMHVEIITTHNSHGYIKRSEDGIIIHYLPIPYSNNFSSSKRYLTFIKFVFAALKFSNTIERPTLVYATSTPLTVGIIALWFKWIRKIPYIFEVRDLWPEAPIQLGFIRSPFLKFITLWLEKTIYKNAWKIIALSPGIAKGIHNRYMHADISMIPNMADINYFEQKSLKIHEQKEFIIAYIGTFGKANNIEFVLDLACECQKEKLPIRFQLIGEGAEKLFLKDQINKLGLLNVDLFPFKTRDEIRISLCGIDACITSFLNIPILETSSPNKFFDGLAAGKLSIVNTKGWLKNLVEENKCGFYADPKQPETFPKLILPFIQKKELLETYQKNALQLAKNAFSKEKLVSQICDLIE